jgi:hypothetical protein
VIGGLALFWMIELGALALSQESPGAAPEHAFIEVTTEQEAYFAHEPIRVRLRFGLEQDFLHARVVDLFRRALDVPVQVEARWFENLPGAILLDDGVPAPRGNSERVTVALNDSVAPATRLEDRSVGGRPFTVLEIERTILPTSAGDLVIPEPVLRFAFATRFDDDFLNGRIAVDPREARVTGERLTLRVVPLPETGRPPGFTGAVGRFSLAAEASPPELAAGESLKLHLRIEGEGNLEFFEAPVLPALDGFHVLGRIEEKSRSRRTITYDVAPLGEGVKEIPPIAFTYFETGGSPGYRTIHSSPIPLEVRPPREGSRRFALSHGADPGAVPGRSDIFGLKSAPSRGRARAARGVGPGAFAIVLVAPWLLALGLLLRLRARERDARDPAGVRARQAAATFRARAASGEADLVEALAEYLAGRLRCPAAAVIAPDLTDRLEAAGVPADLAARTAALLEALVAARYGSGAPATTRESARSLVEELEVAFRAAETAT